MSPFFYQLKSLFILQILSAFIPTYSSKGLVSLNNNNRIIFFGLVDRLGICDFARTHICTRNLCTRNLHARKFVFVLDVFIAKEKKPWPRWHAQCICPQMPTPALVCGLGRCWCPTTAQPPSRGYVLVCGAAVHQKTCQCMHLCTCACVVLMSDNFWVGNSTTRARLRRCGTQI